MTWSTLPSRSTSQKGGDTDAIPPSQNFGLAVVNNRHEQPDKNVSEPTDNDADDDQNMDSFVDETDLMDNAMDLDDIATESDLNEVLQAGKFTVSLVGVSIVPSQPFRLHADFCLSKRPGSRPLAVRVRCPSPQRVHRRTRS